MAFSDSAGRFVIDSVPLGTYRATLEHERLDTLGISSVMTTVNVRGPIDSLRVGTPSARTLWSRFCAGDAPYDSGFVFGVVRKPLTRETVAKQPIVASWTELNRAGGALSQKEYRLESSTAEDGAYALCGLPTEAVVHIASGADSTAAELDVILSRATPMRRQDVTLADVKSSGSVRGVITSAGKPLANARVSIGNRPEVRTNTFGRFVIPSAPVGTQQLEIQAIGFTPAARIIDVPADTVTVAITLDRAVVLDSVRVTSSTVRLAREFGERRARHVGFFKDSTEIEMHAALEGVFIGMPVVTRRPRAGGDLQVQLGVDSRGRPCYAQIFVDGMRSAGRLSTLQMSDLAAIEVYRMGEMPRDLAGRLGVVSITPPCAVVAWTKSGIR
jgi:hypothetical protein